MSDNPFKDPPPEPAEAVAAKPVMPAGDQSFPPTSPGGLTPLLVFCTIFGVLGLIGTCVGGGFLLAMPLFENMIEGSPIPEEQKAFQKLAMASQQPVMLPSLILMAINLVVATALIIGSIGCFKRKESSRNFLRLALLGAIFYSLLKIGVTVYAYFASNAALNKGVEALVNEPIYQDVKAQVTANHLMSVITLVFGIVIALVIMGFYIWARGYLGKSEVEEHFAAVQAYKNSASS